MINRSETIIQCWQESHHHCILTRKEKLEGVLATSTFDSKLYKATSNSTSNQPTTAELYTIADHSFIRDDLVKILVTIKSRLESDQKDKWKRVRKTLQLTEFLMKNGSIEFVSYASERLRLDIEPYVHYEFLKDYDDVCYAIRECAKRIVELCKDREKLKKERAEGKRLRSKIVGVGNTVDSYGDKFMPPAFDDDKKISSAQLNSLADRVNAEKISDHGDFGGKGYDPQNRKAKTLAEKLGVDSDSDTPVETEKKLPTPPNSKKNKKQNSEKVEDKNDDDFLSMKEKNQKKEVAKEDEEIDFLS